MFAGAVFHASTPIRFFGSSAESPSPSTSPAFHSYKFNLNSRFTMASSVRIVVVGDVHDDWNLQEDTKALQLLRVIEKSQLGYDKARFGAVHRQVLLCDAGFLLDVVGDFGNENVELVRSIAALKIAKAVILGNHDAWNTQTFAEKWKDGVQLQLESLGEEHVGYNRLDFPLLKLSVVGGRPFSCGGERLFRKRLLATRYGVHDMNGSAKRISQAALGTPEDHSIILLAHNGPTGLGSNMEDICGRDWVPGGGDHGDPDLALAISQLKRNSPYSVPLVVFGHMHKQLAFGNSPRKMMVVGSDNTIYLNGAIVPRVKRFSEKQATYSSSSSRNDTPTLAPNPEGTLRAFTLVEAKEGKLEKIAETWVSVIGDQTTVEEERILFPKNWPKV